MFREGKAVAPARARLAWEDLYYGVKSGFVCLALDDESLRKVAAHVCACRSEPRLLRSPHDDPTGRTAKSQSSGLRAAAAAPRAASSGPSATSRASASPLNQPTAARLPWSPHHRGSGAVHGRQASESGRPAATHPNRARSNCWRPLASRAVRKAGPEHKGGAVPRSADVCRL